jgi:pyrroloquinoline quinone biosynthesis protein B
MIRFITLSLFTLLLAAAVCANRPYVLVLGTAQDAGAPQMGCMSEFCKKAWKNKKLRKMVSSIALAEPDSGKRWIFDATPDLPAQFQFLKKTTGDYSNRLDGIFLTHAHIGHYTGLMYLGRESMGANQVPVYAMPRMGKMLSSNAPWSQLVGLKNIKIYPLENKKTLKPGLSVSVEPFLVPHRDEFSETVGYRIATDQKSLIFLPDINKWSKWDVDLIELVKENDYLLLDGTFYEAGEISRPMSEVPHPFVSETMERLKTLLKSQTSKVHFIHFNHSNPLQQGNKKKIKEMKKKGFLAAYEGLKLQL